MITVVLMDRETTLAHVQQEGNDALLGREEDQDFWYLSDVSQFSPTSFAARDMEGLIAELQAQQQSTADPELASHLQDVIDLAEQCRGSTHLELIFTPFEWKPG